MAQKWETPTVYTTRDLTQNWVTMTGGSSISQKTKSDV